MKRIMIFIIIIISIAKVEALNVTLDSCIDGDTARFIVNNQSVKVRFLSINAPEIEGEDKKAEYMGEEAKNYTCELLTNAKNIKFSPFGENKKSKKFLLKKMMSSYNVPTEYQFIDNKKLTTDNDLINQQLILKYDIYPSN